MRHNFKCFPLLIIATAFSTLAFAQMRTIKGTIIDQSSGETVPAVSVIVKGSGEGTYTNGKGEFSLDTKAAFPVTLVVSSIGYEQQNVTVPYAGTVVKIIMIPASTLGQGVVVSATRTPSRILESPVTIERITSADIRNSASVSYYDMISKLKEVDVVTASLTFVSPSTRGFNGSGNTRVNQIVDGMDNRHLGLISLWEA
ncbi:MAG: carboxypeptidase-like regulatory domain-containing protein [Ginsengibacter sp.]